MCQRCLSTEIIRVSDLNSRTCDILLTVITTDVLEADVSILLLVKTIAWCSGELMLQPGNQIAQDRDSSESNESCNLSYVLNCTWDMRCSFSHNSSFLGDFHVLTRTEGLHAPLWLQKHFQRFRKKTPCMRVSVTFFLSLCYKRLLITFSALSMCF